MPFLTYFRRLLASAVMAAALTLCLDAAAQEPIVEADVKAAYLYNFTKFVEWPAAAADGGPFRICVIGDPRFSATLDRVIAGESVNGRALARVEPRTSDEARSCRILFIGRSEPELGTRMLAAVRQSPVLTVGDSARFIDDGGVIRFVMEGSRVRFDISMPAADRAGLKVSSKLLRVARVVKEQRE